METTTAGITAEARAKLRQPFAASAVKWVPIGGLVSDGQAVMLQPHINASLVFERLSEVDPSWTHDTNPMIFNPAADKQDPFGLAHMAPWKCSMTVLGVTRHGIGQLEPVGKQKKPPTVSSMHLKTGYSDAIKRAALEFEVGAYLRALDSVYLKRQDRGPEMFRVRQWDGNQSFSGLTADGKRVLAERYTRFVSDPEFVKRYGEAVEYGDAVIVAAEGDDHEITPAPDAEPTTTTVDDAQADVLVLMAGYNGRDTTEEIVRETLASKPFGRCLPQMLNSVKANLKASAEDGEKLRTLAIAAADGDEKAFAELAQGLDQLQTLAEGEGDGEAE